MNIRETNKGNIKMTLTPEQFRTLYVMVNFTSIGDWKAMDEDNKLIVKPSQVWDAIRGMAYSTQIV